MTLPRRRFLGLGIVSGALFATGGLGLAWFRAGYALESHERPVALTSKEFVIVRAIVRALCPADGELPSGDSLGLAQRVDEEVWAADPDVARDLAWGLQLLEHAPRFYGMRGRLTAMTPDDARLYLEKVLLGPRESLRQVAIAIRQLVTLLYYANAATWKAIGYDGPLISQAVPPDSHKKYLTLIGSGS